MAARVELKSLEIENYLGAGVESVTLEFNGGHSVLCGPNGSGKTTVLSALDCLKRCLLPFASHSGLPFLQAYGGETAGEQHQVIVWEWTDGRPQLTADVFHTEAEVFRVVTEAIVPLELLPPQLRFAELHDPTRCGFEIQARRDQKVRLETLRFGDYEIFRNGSSTHRFSPAGGERQGWIKYLTPFPAPVLTELFGMPFWLLQRTIFFPSYRRASLGSDGEVGALAAGAGLISWIETATNPDPRDRESQRRHQVLQEFQQEFAEFAGFRSVSLSVRKYSLPLQNDDIEVNVTVDGRLRLLSQLGAGLGESLIILLVAKLSQEWRNPPVDIVLVEEPELHIHPSLQRRLLDKLAAYGVQLIAATHSPTVVNWFARNGARVFRTEYQSHQKRTAVWQVSGLRELRGLIESIGASPADVVLADKILLVEGSNDVPVFKAWLRKAPSNGSQSIAVLALGGSDAASSNFDPEHPKIGAILDSERKSVDQEPQVERQEIKAKLETVGIRCHLTERRSTESYFTQQALKSVYGNCPDSLDPFGDSNLANQGVKQFTKSRNGEVAQAMQWVEIETTDIGRQIEDFLKA